VSDEIEKLEALARAAGPAILPIIDRLKKAETQREALSSAYRSAAERAEKAEAERDETRQFLDELQGEFDKQNTAFWATSEKLRIAEAELKAIKECNPNNALAVSASELLEALQACLDYGVMTGDEWVEAKARATIHAYASPIAAPVPATQPKAEMSDERIMEIATTEGLWSDARGVWMAFGGENDLLRTIRAILAEASK